MGPPQPLTVRLSIRLKEFLYIYFMKHNIKVDKNYVNSLDKKGKPETVHILDLCQPAQ